MPQTVSDHLLDRLEDWGVHRLFGYPGDGINGVFGALGRAGDRFDFIQARHEETAALMSVAHAKLTGELGVCIATSGPGAVHLLNGLYDARKDQQPVLAIVGQQPRSALGADQHQELALDATFNDVAHDFCVTVTVPEQLRMAVDRAARIAISRRTVTCIILPNDVQELDAVPMPDRAHAMQRTSCSISMPNVVPAQRDLIAAGALLDRAERVAILIGSGARGAVTELRQVADVLGAGIAKALLGKDVLPDDEPHVTGSIGLLGTRASWELMQHCDALLMVGTSFPYSEFLPEDVPGVQIDLDPTRVGMRYPTTVNLVGDAALTLRALLVHLHADGRSTSWRDQIAEWIHESDAELEDRAHVAADPINPQLVAHELSRHLPDQAIVLADSGTAVSWYARHVKLRAGMRGTLSGQLASMGVGVPYAIAAKLAHPNRPVVAFLGDGSMQMNGLAELLTIRRYQDRWKAADPRLVVAVLDNSDLNMVTWEQRAMSGDPRLPASQDLPAANYAEIAHAMGMRSIRIEHTDQVAQGWRDAFAADEPVLLDFIVDPNVPPMPPHVTFEQARNLMFALAHGDEERGGIVRQLLRR